MGIEQTKAYFIGVGGIGMSALAQLFDSLGAQVSGSDIKEGKHIKELVDRGIEVHIGHLKDNITEDVDVIVYSSAIDQNNPEIQQAKQFGIPIIRRAEALAEVMRFKRGIAVAGTHGKTTTTSLLSSVFLSADMDPTIAVGGRLKLIESTARLGQGPWMVAEADESDGSFARLQPEISIITNIDSDHLDHFGSFENLQKAFYSFAMNIPYYGAVVVNGDDPKVRELFKTFPKKVYYYGENNDNQYVLKKTNGTYEVFENQNLLGRLKLQVPGRHNALNALAACIAAHLTGLSWDQCIAGVNQYSGVDRRFQKIGEIDNISIYDDYAHHPTEIRATISAANELNPNGKLHLIYQPHRYSRTKDCWNDYKNCFEGVGQLYLLDIYPAGEKPIERVTSENLAHAVQADAIYVRSQDSLLETLQEHLKPGDIVMTMGAGNVWQLSGLILETLKK